MSHFFYGPSCASYYNFFISSSARNLGFYMPDDMRVELHINNICQLAYFELCCIISNAIFFLLTVQKHLYQLLPSLGYANPSCCFLLKAVLNTFFRNYEKVQNSAARHAQGIQDHFLILLRALHWLPVQLHIEYKLSTLCHSSFSDTAPVYLSDLLHVSFPSRQLRSTTDSRTLCIPHVTIKISGLRSSLYPAPSIWNSLPQEVKTHSVNHCI